MMWSDTLDDLVNNLSPYKITHIGIKSNLYGDEKLMSGIINYFMIRDMDLYIDDSKRILMFRKKGFENLTIFAEKFIGSVIIGPPNEDHKILKEFNDKIIYNSFIGVVELHKFDSKYDFV